MIDTPHVGSQPCLKCDRELSYRRAVVELFTQYPNRLFTRGTIFEALVEQAACCGRCTTLAHLGSLLYHLRQDGVVERVGRGTFRYRTSDANSPDFVYARRPRKP